MRSKQYTKNMNNYIANPKICVMCQKTLPYNKRKGKFCNHSCSASFNNKGVRRHGTSNKPNCLNCEKQCKRKIYKYCSNECQQDFEYKIYINEWLNGLESGKSGAGVSHYIKRWLFEKNNNQCQECKWSKINPKTNNIPLEVDHIDGNWQNNNYTNLRLLCPNCHSLTPNYKNSNKGNGRPFRRIKVEPLKGI